MFLVTMKQQQRDRFTHPQRFLVKTKKTFVELDKIIRNYGFVGDYDYEVIDELFIYE